MPEDWRPLRAVGTGAIEIRIHVGTEHRVVVVRKFEEAIYVLHAFDKKTRKTAQRDVDLARRRYKEMVAERRSI